MDRFGSHTGDCVVDYLKYWTDRSGTSMKQLLAWLELAGRAGKIVDARDRKLEEAGEKRRAKQLAVRRSEVAAKLQRSCSEVATLAS